MDEAPDIVPLYALLQRSATTATGSNDSLPATALPFGALDTDALLLIAHDLVPRLGAANWIEKAKAAAADLNSLVRSCRFWRAVLCGVGHALRLEAFALAQGCIPSPLLPRGAAIDCCFAQMLVQERHLVQLRVLECAVELMLTHCTLSHCTDALRAMRTYRSSPFLVDQTSVSMLNPKHELGRRALEGKCVEMHVASTSATFKMGIVASQAARGTASGGVLLASAGLPQDRPNANLHRPVFTYVASEKAQLYTPASELKKGALFSPQKEVTATSVCGDVAILCLDEEGGDDVFGNAHHVLSLWSVLGRNEKPIAESSIRNGRAVEVWAIEGESSDLGPYLEIFTLVLNTILSEEGNWRDNVSVRTERYARDADVWAVMTTNTDIGLGSYRTYGTDWRYVGVLSGPYPKGVSLYGRAKVASESQVGTVALCVCGWVRKIPHFPEDSDTMDRTTLVYRIIVASKNAERKSTHFDCGALPPKVDVINVFRAPYDGVDLIIDNVQESKVPHFHLSPCGTLLVTTSKKSGTAPDLFTIYRRDPERGWQRRARHGLADSYSTISGTSLKPPDCLWQYEFGDWPRAINQKATLIEWGYPLNGDPRPRRDAESAFSPCGKYLAMLTRRYIFVIDLHASLCHETLHVRFIRVNDKTRPLAIAWPDGVFVETGHGVWHIGTYDAVASP